MLPPPRNPSSAPDSFNPSTAGVEFTRSESCGCETAGNEFSAEERAVLLRLAHESILSALDGRKICLDPPTSHLAEARGALTLGFSNAALRGCVGYVLATSSIYRTVAETACAAAFEDTRFQPVSREEAHELTVELSI